jgi:hypothetical protein
MDRRVFTAEEHAIIDEIDKLFPTQQFIESDTLMLDKEEVLYLLSHFANKHWKEVGNG